MVKPRFEAIAADVPRPTWSVIVPTCEPRIDYLRATIDSIFAAGLPQDDFELLLVDDASVSPELRGFVPELERRGAKVVLAPQRAGLAGNWNRGIAMARGRFIHILHQDDRVRPGFYPAMQQGLASGPTIGAAFCGIAFVDSAGQTSWIRGSCQPDTGVLRSWVEHVLVDLAIQCPGIAVRRDVYETLGGFDDSYMYAVDLDMWRRIASAHRLWYDPRPLAEFRRHAANTSARIDLPTRWKERFRCLAAAQPYLDTIPVGWAERARRRQLRFAVEELTLGWPAMSVLERSVALRALRPNLTMRDAWRMIRGKLPHLPDSRTPDPGDGLQEPHRRARIVMMADFFPNDPSRDVFGLFQRMGAHARALSEIATLEILFIKPGDERKDARTVPHAAAMLRRKWGVERFGFVGFDLKRSEFLRDPLRAAFWVARGVTPFRGAELTMQIAGRKQALRLNRLLAQLQPDLIFAFRQSALTALIRSGAPHPPVVLDFDDLEHVQIRRRAELKGGAVARTRGRFLALLARRAAGQAARRASVALVCSEVDRAMAVRFIDGTPVVVMPNAVEPAALLRPPRARRAVFVGVASYAPNREAIEWLLSDLWPRVRSLVPDAVLDIVGEGSAAVAASDPDRGLIVHGFVEDLSSVYASADIALCPLLRGSGTRIKIIEAAMRGRPVVSTEVGAEGLTFRSGEEIVIADGAAEFAAACARLFTHPDEAERIGMAAHRRAAAEYTLSAAAARLQAVVRPLLPPAAFSDGA